MLPHVFKPIGFTVAAVAFMSSFIFLGFKGEIDAKLMRFIGECVKAIIIIGLLAAAFSREKQEDEMLQAFRQSATFFAFSTCALYAAIHPIYTSATHNWVPQELSATHVVMFMLMLYHMMFWFMRRKARNEKYD